MTVSDRPDARWWVKPALIAVANIVVLVTLVTFLAAWSTPVVLVVLVGFGFGSWWFLDQRPGRH